MLQDPEHKTPGQLIRELLEQRGWSQRVLAIVLGMNETTLAKILSGKRPLDAELALVFGELFEVPAERFLELQKTYELAIEMELDFKDDVEWRLNAPDEKKAV